MGQNYISVLHRLSHISAILQMVVKRISQKQTSHQVQSNQLPFECSQWNRICYTSVIHQNMLYIFRTASDTKLTSHWEVNFPMDNVIQIKATQLMESQNHMRECYTVGHLYSFASMFSTTMKCILYTVYSSLSHPLCAFVQPRDNLSFKFHNPNIYITL